MRDILVTLDVDGWR